jgi:hypothetical protein
MKYVYRSLFAEMGVSLVGNEADSLMDVAFSVLENQCMKEKGFTSTEVDLDPSDYVIKDLRDYIALEWGVYDVEKAKKYGYTTYGNSYVDENGDLWGFDGEKYFNDTKIAREMIAEQEKTRTKQDELYSYEFHKDGGCSDIAADRFYEGLNLNVDRSNQVGALKGSAETAAKADSRMVSLINKWSSCMKEKGYNFNDTLTARNETFNVEKDRNGWDTPHKKAEIATAVADATCKTDLNFIETWFSILREHEERVIQENLPFFEEEKAYIASLGARAQEIIKEYG